MKKINISYINRNKFSESIKFLCIGTAITLTLVGCNKKQVNKPSNQDNTSIVSEEIHNTSSDTMSIDTSSTTHSYIENDVISNTSSEIITSETSSETTSNIVSGSYDNFNIANIQISNKEVSVYNSDYEISEELKNQINKNIKNYGGDCSFLVVNLNDGMSFGYNIDKSYPTASTIKAAVCLYAIKQMDSGNGSLEELKLYEEKFRRGGSGVLQNKKSGTYYSLKDLIYYTIDYSDNTAYYMVHDRFYSDGYNDFLKKLGCTQLYLKNNAKWGKINARSMALVWQEIYNYKDATENSRYYFELLNNAKYNYIKEGMKNYDSAHKSGWTPNETHDSGIVFANDDYIVITLNNNNGNYSAKSQLIKISSCIEKIIDEYELYKKDNLDKQKVYVR